jgi:hypothetical protein
MKYKVYLLNYCVHIANSRMNKEKSPKKNIGVPRIEGLFYEDVEFLEEEAYLHSISMCNDSMNDEMKPIKSYRL